MESIVERAVALYEKQARRKMSKATDTLSRLLKDPKRGELFEELMAAIRERSFRNLTKEQLGARAAEGGKKRAENLSDAQKSAIAKKAALARWKNKKQDGGE